MSQPPGGTATVLVVMGVSGSGKTTIGKGLADRFGWAFQEGDDLHPAANVAKMAAGQPLNDEDRGPWLDLVADWISDRFAAGESGVITCSALRRRYRDTLRDAAADAGAGSSSSRLVLVYLRGDRSLLAERMRQRTGHFMPPALLDSQWETLEPPGGDEHVVAVDLGGTAEQELDRTVQSLAEAGVSAPAGGSRSW